MPPKRKPRGGGRVDYAVAGARSRAVLFAANGSDLTVRQHRVLSAVIAFTGLYSRIGDRVYLAQIAAFAHGVQEAAPWMVKKTRETLAELEDLDLVAKVPPRGRPPAGHAGPSYWIALGTPESDPAPGVPFSPESDPAPGSKVTPPPDRKAPRPRVESDPGSGGESDPAPGPPTEKSSEEAPEEPSEEGRRGARPARVNGTSAVGSLAARLTACATTDDLATSREAERVAELILDHFAGEDADAALQLLADAGSIPRPGAVLPALELVVDDDQAPAVEALYADRRFRALAGDRTAYAIADASPDPWTDRLPEAELVAEHFTRHGLPAGIVDQVLEHIAAEPLRRPGHAARIARDLAEELGIELPRLELPQARPVKRSPTP